MTQQDQMMMQQMEQLQRLVKEQQKLITFMNPGLTFSPGLTSQLIPRLPSLAPHIPSPSFSVEMPLNGPSQMADNGSIKTVTGTMQSPVQQSTSESSCLSSDTQSTSLQAESNLDAGPKCLSPVREEKDEESNPAPLSPFGVRPRTATREDRPIRPGVGERQKTFEEFVEEQLKADSQIVDKEQLQPRENTSDNKIGSRKSFLRRGEGITRFEKKTDNQNKEQRRGSLTRRVSFDSQHQKSLPGIQDTGKGQVKNQLVFQRQVSSNSVSATKENNLDDNFDRPLFYKKGEVARNQTPSNELLEQSTGESSVFIVQDVQDIATCTENVPMENCLSTNSISSKSGDFDNDKIREDPKKYEWQNSNQSILEKYNYSDLDQQNGAVVISDHNSVSANNTDSDIAGFKKVNDKIVKVAVESSRKFDQAKPNQTGQLQRGKSVSHSETDSTSSDSDDDPKSLCYKLPMRVVPQKVNQEDKHLDLSDPDYASDDPSDVDEKKYLKSSAKFFLSQQDHSLSTSGSEHSVEDFRRRGSKAFSSFRKPSFRRPRTQRVEKEPNAKSVCDVNTESAQLRNPPSTSNLVVSLFPAFKAKAELPEILEPSKKTNEVQIDNSMLVKMKEEQEKAMQFLREQIDHFEKMKAEELSRLEELKQAEIKKLQKENEELARQASAKAIRDSEKNEEIQMLKQQISELQGEFRRNESRWSSNHENLRSQVEALTKENQELRVDLRTSESQRIEENNRESLVSQAIIRGTSFRRSIQRSGQSSNKSRSSTPVGRKTPSEKLQSSENLIKESNPIERPEIPRSSTRAGDKALSGSFQSRSTTPTGRKTPVQGRLTPFEPEKVAAISVHSAHRKSPVTVSHFSVFKDPNVSAHTKGRRSSQSGSSEDAPFSSQGNEDFITTSQSSIVANQDADNNVRKVQEQQEQVGASSRKMRSRSVTPSGRKSSIEHSQSVEIKNSAPKSILSKRSSFVRVENKSSEEDNVQEETQYPDGKVEKLLSDGRRIVIFSNGTKKEISADEKSITVSFFNGDTKKIMPDQSIVYYYADAQTTHTTYPSGLEVLQFPNKQIEKHHPDGTKEIVFPDRTVKLLFKDGREESTFPDGTVVKSEKTGNKTVIFSNGQKEIHTSQYKRREYPDGTIKTVYSNGRQETKYSSGRVRIKDQQGNIILDKK
ncbi:centromere protein J-like [Bombina bombina]|uniref:centromere protein J-like n=1 Tax=Bombina bombina TaxID=8345 RepID=UPI00235B1BE5|nr:centromere protein J-like [Bombina bombina]